LFDKSNSFCSEPNIMDYSSRLDTAVLENTQVSNSSSKVDIRHELVDSVKPLHTDPPLEILVQHEIQKPILKMPNNKKVSTDKKYEAEQRKIAYQSDNARAKSPTAERKQHALVIDDSLVIRKTISRALTSLGFEVSLAINGE